MYYSYPLAKHKLMPEVLFVGKIINWIIIKYQ